VKLTASQLKHLIKESVHGGLFKTGKSVKDFEKQAGPDEAASRETQSVKDAEDRGARQKALDKALKYWQKGDLLKQKYGFTDREIVSKVIDEYRKDAD
jgi:macrodomain Ter protein organizer (MatP/YcbG family)